MEYIEFYNKVNDSVKNLTNDEIKSFLNNILRKIPENKYKEVLLVLEEDKKLNINDIKMKVKYYEEKFKLIEDAELVFHATGYEDYGEYYSWDSDWIWEYTDEENISDLINETISYAITLVDQKEYKYSKRLFDLVLSTNYQFLDDDGGDIMEISLTEMKENHLININLNNVCLYNIYTTYQSFPSNRAQEIHKLFKNRIFSDISVQDSFKIGIEILKEQEDFWYEWINVLTLNSGKPECRLLKEALEYNNFNNYEKYLDNINKNHPKIYLDIFEFLKKNNKIKEIVKLGNEALQSIDKNLIIRQDISLYLAEFDEENKEKYIVDSFCSDSSVINLIRVVNNGYYEKNKEIIQSKIICSNSNNERYFNNELAKNIIDKKTYYILKFFTGKYEEVFKECLKHNKSLGWSGDYIQILVYLFLLTLNKSNLKTKSYNSMLNYVFDGLNIKNSNLSFLDSNTYDLFIKWKPNFSIDEKLSIEILDWLEKIIKLRVDGIVSGGHRKSYYKAALLVVALDEVLYTRNIYERNYIINLYMNNYPRHSSFKKEIKELI